MKKATKRSMIILCAILVLLTAGILIASRLLPQPLSYDIKGIEPAQSGEASLTLLSEADDTVTVKCRSDKELKILLFTDLHLDGKNETSSLTVENLVKNIQKEKPDLVLLGGDTVSSGFNKKRVRQISEIFEQLGVYWAGVLGNHEGDNPYSVSREKMMDIFMQYEHCLMLKGPQQIWGNCNYCLNILNPDDTLRQTFYFLDTGNDAAERELQQYKVADDGRHLYDGVKEDQVAWYSEKVKQNEREYGKSRSVMVIHIPLFQMRQAAETEEYLYGDKRENVCSSCFDSGLFDAVKNSGSTKAVFFGHDHVNNFALKLDGILLSYIEPSGYGSYTALSKFGYEEKDWLQGYTRLTVRENGTFTNEFFRNSETK